MTSVLTNAAANAALQTLRSVSGQLTNTQSQVSSGLLISDAADGVAYWSISTSMQSANKAISAATDTFGVSKSIMDVTYAALDTVKESLDTLKSLVVTAASAPSLFDGSESFTFPGVDGKRVIDNFDPDWQTTYAGTEVYKLDMEAAAALNNARAAMNSASFAGVNLLVKEDDGESLDEDFATLVTAFGDQKVQKLQLDARDFVLINKGQTATDKSEDGMLDGLTGYYNAEGAWTQAGNWTLFTAKQGGEVNDIRAEGVLFDVDLGMWHQGSFGLDREAAFNQWLTNLDQQIRKIVTTMANVGSIQNHLKGLEQFSTILSDSIDRGISRLVDADMEEASARLTALEIQQQLSIQSLQISNSQPEVLLSLFQS